MTSGEDDIQFLINHANTLLDRMNAFVDEHTGQSPDQMCSALDELGQMVWDLEYDVDTLEDMGAEDPTVRSGFNLIKANYETSEAACRDLGL